MRNTNCTISFYAVCPLIVLFIREKNKIYYILRHKVHIWTCDSRNVTNLVVHANILTNIFFLNSKRKAIIVFLFSTLFYWMTESSGMFHSLVKLVGKYLQHIPSNKVSTQVLYLCILCTIYYFYIQCLFNNNILDLPAWLNSSKH